MGGGRACACVCARVCVGGACTREEKSRSLNARALSPDPAMPLPLHSRKAPDLFGTPAPTCMTKGWDSPSTHLYHKGVGQPLGHERLFQRPAVDEERLGRHNELDGSQGGVPDACQVRGGCSASFRGDSGKFKIPPRQARYRARCPK